MISNSPSISAAITFLAASEGGRLNPAYNSNAYRPHLVVGDKHQRIPITAADSRSVVEEYLGVCFTGNGEIFLPGKSYDVTLLLVYHPQVCYGRLQSGATFTVREGGKIVGFGVVSKGIDQDS